MDGSTVSRAGETGRPPRAVVLFDGTCAFCERSAVFIANRDPTAYFRFGASQSPEAVPWLEPFGAAGEGAGSLILIEDGHLYLRSTAALRIAARLTRPWSILGVLLWIPAAMRDPVYRVVAAVRHRLAGPSNACNVPPPGLRGRMI